MTKFNPNVLNDPLGGIAMSYGIPSCMVGLTKDILSLIPGNTLGSIRSAIFRGKANAIDVISQKTKQIFDGTGIIQFNTETGLFYFQTESAGADAILGDNLNAVSEFVGNVLGTGQVLWKNYEAAADAVEIIGNCIGDFADWLEKGENKSDVNSTQELANSLGRFNASKEAVNAATSFIEQADATIRNIDAVFQERADDPGLIPVFEDISEDEESTDPIFRLTFGPPKSKKGQFLLSVDGLYYDSQGEDGIPSMSDIGFIPDESKWELDHAANLGGRGKGFSTKDLDRYVDTLFDLDKIDNTQNLEEYYEADHLLQVLISNKNVRVEDLNDNLKDLLAGGGYTVESALYINLLQQLNSEIAAFDAKINKRKKQIEVAVKAPDLFGATDKFTPGTVPINDFSYLSAINLGVEIEKQKGLVFDHGEVDDVVLPIQPLFVKSEGTQQGVVLTPLLGGTVGAGSMLDGEELEGDAPVISLTTGITTDGMVCVYNFTDANLQKPGDTTYKTLNCNALGTENRGKLVSLNPTVIYRAGLGVPYLNGIPIWDKSDALDSRSETWDTFPFEVKGVGNYLELPNTQPFQDLMYNPSGCTIDVWTKISGYNSEADGWWEHPYDTSAFDINLSSTNGNWLNGHFYRILMGCENTGGKDNNIDASGLIADRSSDFVRGMLMGFSRDPKMYYLDAPVVAGSTDLDIRDNWGYAASGVTDGGNMTNVFHEDFETNDVVTWSLSSDINGNLIDAPIIPSGSAKVKGNFKGLKAITLTQPGDFLPASAHGTEYKLQVYPTSAVSANPDIVGNTPSGIVYFAHVDEPFAYYQGVPSSCFFIAPTQSYNTTGVGFVKAGSCDEDSEQLLRFTASLDKTVSGVSLASISSEYMHLAIVFDPVNDAIKLYVDGVLYEEGLISTTFNVSKGQMPQVPSLITPSGFATSSFYYNKNSVSAGGEVLSKGYFDSGPAPDGFFTPWIVGGGYSDGRDIDLTTSSGGFMSTGDGLISPYNGNVGSLKIYCKALNTNEVKKNFDSQKTFFKNIT